jgi:hypothetical protein
MKDYDFVEIGTCYFDTLIEGCDDSAVGISIEPLLMYLAALPNKPNVTKVNAAMVAAKDMSESRQVDMYYVHPNTINQYRLGGWLAGCNTIGKPHDFHVNYYPEPGVWHDTADKSTLKTINLLQSGLVTHEKVNCITFAELVGMFDIGKIGFLKTDTEGYDCILLQSVLDYYEDKKDLLPNKIRFESNAHTPPDQVAELCERLKNFGYTITPSESGHDTLAVRN